MKNDLKNEQTSGDLEKEARISKEKKRLSKLFTQMPTKTKKAVKSLIDNAAFMAITLEDLVDVINVKGVTEEYQNGANQRGVKKCSEVEVYNAMVKNHMIVMKQLTDLVPNEPAIDPSEEILKFAVGGRK